MSRECVRVRGELEDRPKRITKSIALTWLVDTNTNDLVNNRVLTLINSHWQVLLWIYRLLESTRKARVLH